MRAKSSKQRCPALCNFVPIQVITIEAIKNQKLRSYRKYFDRLGSV